jgi:hypothetical protein
VREDCPTFKTRTAQEGCPTLRTALRYGVPYVMDRQLRRWVARSIRATTANAALVKSAEAAPAECQIHPVRMLETSDAIPVKA